VSFDDWLIAMIGLQVLSNWLLILRVKRLERNLTGNRDEPPAR
jgi:hypothetical protein